MLWPFHLRKAPYVDYSRLKNIEIIKSNIGRSLNTPSEPICILSTRLSCFTKWRNKTLEEGKVPFRQQWNEKSAGASVSDHHHQRVNIPLQNSSQPVFDKAFQQQKNLSPLYHCHNCHDHFQHHIYRFCPLNSAVTHFATWENFWWVNFLCQNCPDDLLKKCKSTGEWKYSLALLSVLLQY